MSNLEMKVDALMRLVASEDGPGYDKAKAEILRLMNVNAAPAELDVEEEIVRSLLELGVPQHILGYQYIVDAVRLAAEDRRLLNNITKGLYQAVAEINGTTASRVERAIRHAIELTLDRADLDVLEEYFGGSINPNKGKPTNSEFLSIVSNRVRRKMKRSKAAS